jgi:putative toxin-antitoxin system antitoxin component (TIGR02293 family)
MSVIAANRKVKRHPEAIPFTNKLGMIELINKGISASTFKDIEDTGLLHETEWASILNISSKSLHRYKQSEQHFKSTLSDKILQVAEVFSVGLDVFGNKDRFKLWLNTPNYALGSIKPVELVKTSYGKDLVLNELKRINYGILS